MIYINNREKLDRIKLNKDNYYIVADFDKTMSAHNSKSTWDLFSKIDEFGSEYVKKCDEMYKIYRPIEADTTVPFEEKLIKMEEWWNANLEMFFEYGLTESKIREIAKSGILKYREGAREFLKEMHDKEIPFIIVSAGIGNSIIEFLKYNNDLYDNIEIVSNFLKFEDDKLIRSDEKIIHSLNKNIVNLKEEVKDKIRPRKYIVAYGDLIEDKLMIPEKRWEDTIFVGFLDNNIYSEENLENYNKNFDIVATNNASFKEVNLKIF